MAEALQGLELWLEGLTGAGGYRGLVVAHSSDTWGEARLLARLLRRRLGPPVLCAAPREARGLLGGLCDRVVSPGAVEEILGYEAAAVVVAARGLLRPNLVAAAAEAVRAGGVAALTVPPLQEWSPGGEMSTGAWKRYLLARLSEAESIYWYCRDRGTVYASRLPQGRAPASEPPRGVEPRTPGMPKRLLEAAANREQAEALDRAAGFLASRGRGLLITGDRGRGKSGLLGLLVAWLVKTGRAGFVSVTAPSPWSVQGFFRVLSRGLDAVGVRHWSIERHGLVIGIAGKWFHVRYHTPDQAQPGPYTVVDEAAALGPLRLKALAGRSPRLLAATTIHGYEGSGRILASLVEKLLPRPSMVLELRKPVRYPEGDPLEAWVYRSFMLRAEPPPPPRAGGGAVLIEENRLRLAEDYDRLSRIYGILVSAHYRNEPDDLALMLDAPHHSLFTLYVDGAPVAVADVAWETRETPWEARILYDKLALHGDPGHGARVVRIAVHPALQRRGLGSRLLQGIEAWARSKMGHWIGAVFGRPEVLRFWLRNGYLVVHVSPLPNRVTGEHNIGVAKPLGSGGVVREAARDTRASLLYAAHSLYRSLPVEILAEILATPGPGGGAAPEKPGPGQLRRLTRVERGEADPEHALDVLTMLLRCLLLDRGEGAGLSPGEALVAAGRLLQGRTMRELAPLLGGVEAYKEALASLARKLIRSCKAQAT